MIRAPKSGDRYRVPVCVTTDWRVRRDAVVDVKAVQRLGCSCTRLTVDRPGPAGGELAGPMHLFVGRCHFHAANPPAGVGDEESEWLHEHGWQAIGAHDDAWSCDCGETRFEAHPIEEAK